MPGHSRDYKERPTRAKASNKYRKLSCVLNLDRLSQGSLHDLDEVDECALLVHVAWTLVDERSLVAGLSIKDYTIEKPILFIAAVGL